MAAFSRESSFATVWFYPWYKDKENGDIIRKSVLPGGVEGIVSESRIIQQNTGDPHSQAITSFHVSGDLDERLIEEVRKHEPLYNFRLPLSQRGRKQTKQLWQDISNELNGEISAEGAAKYWKSLRDTFMKIIAEERQPSGSSRVRRKKWRFYDHMSFVRDTLTVSNESQRQSFAEEDVSSDSQPSKSCNRSLKDSIGRIAEAISTPLPSVKLPPIPHISEFDNFGVVVPSKLKNLSKRKSNTMMCQILQLLCNAELEESDCGMNMQ
ncbi:hypothetical protein ALC57_12584 [Trachymyrmex cornetzi]|uniref:MADF domain-containing protein n=1 Tax=Trachymyrmex cornetzi TaxID=471704 RepID=A0A151J0Z3_9HYME|nr:hypothetical protein ALC57_12584 [Trachymyrmex cornetzi]